VQSKIALHIILYKSDYYYDYYLGLDGPPGNWFWLPMFVTMSVISFVTTFPCQQHGGENDCSYCINMKLSE